MAEPNLNTFAPTSNVKPRYKKILPAFSKGIIVIGAGAFGGWSALYLLRNGFKVTLIDAWGAGNSRSVPEIFSMIK
jgi:ribulose 1,5-bisphosphate synthetase/thiazole synthase